MLGGGGGINFRGDSRKIEEVAMGIGAGGGGRQAQGKRNALLGSNQSGRRTFFSRLRHAAAVAGGRAAAEGPSVSVSP